MKLTMQQVLKTCIIVIQLIIKILKREEILMLGCQLGPNVTMLIMMLNFLATPDNGTPRQSSDVTVKHKEGAFWTSVLVCVLEY